MTSEQTDTLQETGATMFPDHSIEHSECSVSLDSKKKSLPTEGLQRTLLPEDCHPQTMSSPRHRAVDGPEDTELRECLPFGNHNAIKF